eukprot:COSAG05_NODE_305_length_11703_cov_15.056705_11_plen_73_part_00
MHAVVARVGRLHKPQLPPARGDLPTQRAHGSTRRIRRPQNLCVCSCHDVVVVMPHAVSGIRAIPLAADPVCC